ncbi:MAG: hypothetical protein EPN88_05790 [Bacteroidetes bacterium]|nr:MAG: hypothetical protein EPN88_05790 [Bacteroidota bacterium]
MIKVKLDNILISVVMAIKPNDPAIWGGCVTRRKHRAVPKAIGTGTLARKLSRCKPAWLPPVRRGGYGALFAVQVQSFVSITLVAV